MMGKEEWKKVKLGEIGKVITGKTPPTKFKDNYGGNIPFITPVDMVGNRLIVSTQRYLTQLGANSVKNCLLPPNTLCVSCIGSDMGKTVITTSPSITNQQINSLIVDEQNDYLFIYYLLRTQEEKIKSLGKNATAVPILNKSKFCDIDISLPPLSTQHRIASILSRYDSLIENYQKQIKLLEEAAARLYKQWFVELKFPGYQNTNIIDGVPEGWEKRKVNELITLLNGFAFKSNTFEDIGTYKIATIKNVKDGAFDGDNVSLIKSIPERMPAHCKLHQGDILLSLTGNVGRVCMVIGDNYLLNQRVAKLKSDYQAFTYFLFRSHEMFIAVNNLANGAAQQNVSPIRIGELPIIVPNDEILNKFEKIAGLKISQILNLQSQIRHLTESRDRLLPQLMSGELEV